jgi:two-component system, cell cycle response regulator CpdR
MRGEGSNLAFTSYLSMSSAPTILLVEPDSAVRDMLCAVLEGAGYTVIRYDSGEDALADLKNTCAINLLVTEVRLPNFDGWQLARGARRLCPGLPVVFIPSYDRRRSKRGRRSFVLPKPLGARAFLIAVQLMAFPLVTYH